MEYGLCFERTSDVKKENTASLLPNYAQPYFDMMGN